MEKYIYLKEGDVLQAGDNQKGIHGWLLLDGDYAGTKVRYSEERENEYRRPVPHTGDVQFLMCVSILVPVIVNCDGKEQEVIEAEAGELAYQKVLDDPRKYINYESIDWEACKVDEIQPEPKNPGQPLSEPQKKNIYDDEGNQIFKKSVVPRYRPFKEGDVIQEGDIFIGASGSWVEIKDWYAGGLTSDMIGNAKYRKLIK